MHWTYAKTYLCDLACADLGHIAHFVNKPDQSGIMLLAVYRLHNIVGCDAVSIENKVQNLHFGDAFNRVKYVVFKLC